MLDADIERFEAGLHATRHGLRLRLAIHEGNIAVNQIERLRFLGARSSAAIASWRRAYIKACETASQAIDALWEEHRWPADGARERSYQYQPPPPPKQALFRPYLGPK